MVAIYHWVIDGDAPFEAISGVLEHLWDAEMTDYETSPVEGHIFENLAKVANWLNSGVRWSPQDYIDARRAGIDAGWRTSAYLDKPDASPDPLGEEHLEMKTAPLTAEMLDISEAAKAAGFTFPVAVTVGVWKHIIEEFWAEGCSSKERNLAHLLHVVADAYAKEGRDVYTWFYADPGRGSTEIHAIKAVHRREAGRVVGLTILMNWEDEV